MANGSSSPGATDSMHVFFQGGGHIKEDHMLDGSHVQATSSQARGYEHIKRTLTEGFENAKSVCLRFLSVKTRNVELFLP